MDEAARGTFVVPGGMLGRGTRAGAWTRRRRGTTGSDPQEGPLRMAHMVRGRGSRAARRRRPAATGRIRGLTGDLPGPGGWRRR